MALPRALARETEHVQLSHAEKMKLRKLARDAGLSPSNYLRSFIGLPGRSPGRPTIEQLEREQDQAWEILKNLGEDPAEYFPPNDDWLDEYK
jgi:hypothetical protein